MPDIRIVLAALDEEDKRLWSQHRTEMRRSYMAAHSAVIGVAAWDANDDAFIDLVDIKLALLFDRSGRFAATKEIVSREDANKIEETIFEKSDGLKIAQAEMSDASKQLKNGWTTKQ
jgi:hypothetical protein